MCERGAHNNPISLSLSLSLSQRREKYASPLSPREREKTRLGRCGETPTKNARAARRWPCAESPAIRIRCARDASTRRSARGDLSHINARWQDIGAPSNETPTSNSDAADPAGAPQREVRVGEFVTILGCVRHSTKQVHFSRSRSLIPPLQAHPRVARGTLHSFAPPALAQLSHYGLSSLATYIQLDLSQGPPRRVTTQIPNRLFERFLRSSQN